MQGVAPTLVISLDNLEMLQDQWAQEVADNAAMDACGQVAVSQPQLNSPRSLESCRRAGIDPKIDLAKNTLKEVLIEAVKKVSPDGSIEIPVQQRDVSATLTAERTRVLQLYPFSLRNVGTDEDKLRAYDKFQQREGRRVSTIRMLREIRQQLIAAEEFKVRKAHESAVAITVKQSPPKPLRSASGAKSAGTPHRSASGASAAYSAATQQTSTKDHGSTRETSQGRPSDGESEISLSTVSTVTGQRHKLTKKTITALESHSRTRQQQSERPSNNSLVSLNRLTDRSKSHDVQAAVEVRQGNVSNFSDDEDASEDDNVFVHHSAAYEDDDVRDGVEVLHITGGPDKTVYERQTRDALRALQTTKREQKRKEAERLAAIERERVQRALEDEERQFIRDKILRGRQLHRKIQTPQPVQWDAPLSSTQPPHGADTMDGMFAASTTRTEGALAGGQAALSLTSLPPVVIHGAFNEDTSIKSAVRSRSATPTGSNAHPVTSQPPSPRGPQPLASQQQHQSPSHTPRSPLPNSLALAATAHPVEPRSPADIAGLSTTSGADFGGSRVSYVNESDAQTSIAKHNSSSKQRREVIEVAAAYRAASIAASDGSQPLSHGSSPPPMSSHLSPPKDYFVPRAEPAYDFSNRVSRAIAAESSYRQRLTHDGNDVSLRDYLRDEALNLEERWKAIERAKRAQDILQSGRTAHDERLSHSTTIYL